MVRKSRSSHNGRRLTLVVVRKSRSSQGAILSGFSWSEKWQAGHVDQEINERQMALAR